MTHNNLVLQLLSDGQAHSHHELYDLRVMGHSRVAALRKQGHTIECWRDGGLYWYRLLLDEGGAPPAGAAAPQTRASASPHAPLVEENTTQSSLRLLDERHHNQAGPPSPPQPAGLQVSLVEQPSGQFTLELEAA